MKRIGLIGLFLASFTGFIFGQNEDERLATVQKALNANQIDSAAYFFEKYSNYHIENGDYLNLSYFIPLAGFIGNKQRDMLFGMEQVDRLLEFILEKSADPRVRRQAHLESHRYFMFAGKIQWAYEANQKALAYTFQMPGHSPSEWAMIERNLGVIATKLDDFRLARSHTLKALEGFNLDPNTSPEDRFNILNDLGASYWFASLWDSAEYYWKEGVAFLGQMENSPTNQLYRRAMIEGNLAAVYDVRGQLEESVNMVKASIVSNNAFIEQAEDDPRRDRAMLSIFYSSMNLAITYKSMGNYYQALRLHEQTLKEKEQFFPEGHPEITESLIMVGQVHSYLMNFDEARNYLNRAIAAIQASEEKFPLRLGDIYYTLALMEEGNAEVDSAKAHYKKALHYFEQTNTGALDFVYFGFIGHAADFFSQQGEKELALRLSEMGYQYAEKTNGIESLPGYHQVINRGRVYQNLGAYMSAKQEAEKGLRILDKLLASVSNRTDSVRIEYEKPLAFLLKWKADYAGTSEPTVPYLLRMLTELKRGLRLLEKRKAMVVDSEDLGVLLSQNQELIDFVKQVLLKLLEKTGEETYLDEVLAIHETSVYTRIRTQLNQQQQVKFLEVPDSIISVEKQLKRELNAILSERGGIGDYLQASATWEHFQELLQQEHPEYYRTRYQDIHPEDIRFPEDQQMVRYFFVDRQLYALLARNGQKQLYALSFDPELLTNLVSTWHDPLALGKLTHRLYQQLWAPFAEQLDGDRVRIIPDGLLFNLSFDLLTDREIHTYEDFARHGLLSKHAISYQFSLWHSKEVGEEVFPANYIAFAPGFRDQMKARYVSSVGDSLLLDRAYLSLLPQPFTVALTERAANLFGGKSITNEGSTPAVFKAQAGQNKIIHIGTHAESNNLSPAFSRLLFAKPDRPEEDHSVYAYEIYNTDLQANLTLLTACETGKPIYKPGEGMVSLAHAFRYAGSESLLTSLLNLDEKSSMEITDNFLNALASGSNKDQALRKAKLQYLTTATGRALRPDYWAGLVLIGDPAPIAGFSRNNSWKWWLGGIAALLVAMVVLSSGKMCRRSLRAFYIKKITVSGFSKKE